ncbi:ATP-binding cassette domain-containing protein [Rhodobacteraceae bacterium 63075]|nr:ATP-binding cassette domain-containing protein [Rhodobacteraceae bacterium 63075]
MQSQSPTTPIFTVTSLSKVYGTGPAAVHALRGLDPTLPEGELVVLLGPSGSGESTLLNIIGGLDRASNGRVIFQGNLGLKLVCKVPALRHVRILPMWLGTP